MFHVPWDDRSPVNLSNRHGIQFRRWFPGETAFVRLLGPWKGAWLHFPGKRSTPCLGESNGCPHCPDPKVLWEGYAPALWYQQTLDLETGKPVCRWTPIVCPIFDAMRQELSQLPDGFVGLVLKITRSKGPKTHHTWELLERTHKVYAEPAGQPFPVEPIMYRFWRLFRRPATAPSILLSDDQAGVERPPQTSEGEAQPG